MSHRKGGSQRQRSASSKSKPKSGSQSARRAGERHKCVSAFTPNKREKEAKMITLRINDVINVTAKFPNLNPPMMKGTNTHTGETGLFPQASVVRDSGISANRPPSRPTAVGGAADLGRNNPLSSKLSQSPVQQRPTSRKEKVVSPRKNAARAGQSPSSPGAKKSHPIKPNVKSGTIRFQGNSKGTPGMKVVKVMFAFESSQQGELTCKPGEVLAVTERDQKSGWAQGKTIEGNIGTFPMNHCVDLQNIDANLLRPIKQDSHGSRQAVREQPAADKEQRRRLIFEFVDTEVYLLGALSQLNEYRIALSKSKWASECETLFSNLTQIIRVVKHFSSLLIPIKKMFHEEKTLFGTVILEVAPFFALYADYGNSYEQAQKRLDSLMQDKKFCALLETVKKSDLRLSDLLIMPVQRVPRYSLLLRDIIKKTALSHRDMANLKRALEFVSALGSNVNETIRAREESEAILSETKNKKFDVTPFLVSPRKLLTKLDGISCEIEKCKGLKKNGDVYLVSPDLLILAFNSSCKPKSELRTDFSHLIWPLSLVQAEAEGKSGRKIVIRGPQETITLIFGKKETEQRTAFLRSLRGEAMKQHVKGSISGSYKGRYETPEGPVYDGEWVNGEMQGTGTQSLMGGVTYAGPFAESFRHGKGGKLTFLDGSTLEGEFQKGFAHGDVKVRYSNGDSYVGRMLRGQRDGEGTYKTKHLTYTGRWDQGEMTGQGELKYRSTVYKGDLLRGRPHGRGTMVNSGGEKSGSWQHGRLHGEKCSIKYSSGTVYIGGCVNGRRHCVMGSLTWKDGSKYQGAFHNDAMSGQGKLETSGALHFVKSYEGQWEANQFHGRGAVLYLSGDTYIGEFKDGEMHGQGTYKSANGALCIEGVWERGALKVKQPQRVNGEFDVSRSAKKDLPDMELKSSQRLNPFFVVPPRPQMPALLELQK